MLKVKQFEFSMFSVNTYLVYDVATKEAAVVDPAMSDAEEEGRFEDYIEKNGLHLTQIINTHLHLDHCFGLDYVKDRFGVPVKAHGDDALLGQMLDQQYQMFGMPPEGRKAEIDVKLSDGDKIQIGESTLDVIHVPGHSEGGIALYNAEAKILIVGDSLFRGSIGRTDLPGGSHVKLINSIKNKLFTLPEDVTVLPGHNGPTTIGYEKANNYFLK